MANSTSSPSSPSHNHDHDPPATDTSTYTTWHPSQFQSPSPTPTTTLDMSTYPNGKKSLAGISLRAFLLGTTLGLSLSATLALLLQETPHYLWRLPFFLTSLSLFHFLEYYITAAYNTSEATVSAFLLASNGWAYNVAHSSAAVECLVAYLFVPRNSYFKITGPVGGVKVQVVLGLSFIILGQVVRSLAMAQAGSNFNHTVQVERKDGHMLVTRGVYAVLRHPSYFGFFWWGLGTQLVLGNVGCLAGYAVVLWNFFNTRIRREERFLIAFFGDDYVAYKKRTWVGIPGIA
ncbi:Isoprenylcysteine carboxyl methyltransferase family-domain-containing protein [Aspergillus cavernicola]|uniref:Protein-S-isoprenylcysteine O-methyltransferase n=1 Tax=Aspergillus cavernicola TaxID=176166 RepID=A0ABR4IYR6_9EURO